MRMSLARDGVRNEEVRGLEDWVWALPIQWEQWSVGRAFVFGCVGGELGCWVGYMIARFDRIWPAGPKKKLLKKTHNKSELIHFPNSNL